ncbi:hypothetical protein CUJ84_pRLN2000316 (plasmid) [Rhizobium leguminosarum]|uniref:Uncharacterized protein n=1 Tax=Rhizobium leguminosarum TaxID=384 RepID=A0A2K9ZF15_RHILE|nr:hypothetical protein CUJ84_pRLN2000316 [Rhizobium leguminosarum]
MLAKIPEPNGRNWRANLDRMLKGTAGVCPKLAANVCMHA